MYIFIAIVIFGEVQWYMQHQIEYHYSVEDTVSGLVDLREKKCDHWLSLLGTSINNVNSHSFFLRRKIRLNVDITVASPCNSK